MTLFATAFIYTQTQLHVPQLVKKYPEFCGILRFMTLLTTACYLFLSAATGMKDTFNIILSSPRSSSGIFLNLRRTPLYTFLFSPIRATCTADLISCDLITLLISG